MTVWHDIVADNRPVAKQGYKVLFYYEAVKDARREARNMAEAVAFDYWPNRPPSKFTIVELPK